MAQTVEYYQQKLRQAQTDLDFARSGGNANEIRVFTARFLAAQNDLETAQLALAGTPPARAVDPAVSPAAAQADATAEEEVGFFGRLFGSNVTDDNVDPADDPFAEGADVSANVNETSVVRFQESEPVNPAEDPFAEGADVNVTEETIVPIRENLNPEPVLATDPVVNDIDEFAQEERNLQNPDGNTKRVANPVESGPYDDEILRRQRANEADTRAAEQNAASEEQERIQQVNNAALDKLRAQSAVQQNRTNEDAADWRVKLRLASGSNYFYNQPVIGPNGPELGPGILTPLAATDGIVFPYTPSIQILYAADYNQYQPTHSNYQHYFYKGSKVGEVVMTATFTAQDTAEANYLLAVIHFLKSASKMFYGQDAQRGSPPPLLFLTGLGDYQFNEAPCVISQFNYVLPNEVDYIRANIKNQIPPGSTLQTDLRNKNNGSSLTSWSSSINRILNSPGLTVGAENPPSRFSGQTANLSTGDATYVPTKMEMTITLLPVQNRLQVSEEFSLAKYSNGSLIKGGFW